MRLQPDLCPSLLDELKATQLAANLQGPFWGAQLSRA